jgi:hypothetical protein
MAKIKKRKKKIKHISEKPSTASQFLGSWATQYSLMKAMGKTKKSRKKKALQNVPALLVAGRGGMEAGKDLETLGRKGINKIIDKVNKKRGW